MVTSGTDADPGADMSAAATASVAHPVAGAVFDVCPYLRAVGGAWRGAHASRDHQCGAMDPAAQVSLAKQRALCLRPEHATCATFLAAAEARGELSETRGDDAANLWPATRSVPVVLEEGRGLLGALAGGRSRTGGQALLVGLMVIAFLVLVVARASGPGSPGAVGASGSPGAAASLDASPAPTLTPAGSASSEPTSTPTPLPSPTTTPSVEASPSAAASQTYTVKPGDTLSAIAAKFGTTVAALSAANNITDPRVIRVGQVLVIP